MATLSNRDERVSKKEYSLDAHIKTKNCDELNYLSQKFMVYNYTIENLAFA